MRPVSDSRYLLMYLYTIINIDRLVVDDRFLDRLYHLRTDWCWILRTMDRTLVVVWLLLAQQVSKDHWRNIFKVYREIKNKTVWEKFFCIRKRKLLSVEYSYIISFWSIECRHRKRLQNVTKFWKNIYSSSKKK